MLELYGSPAGSEVGAITDEVKSKLSSQFGDAVKDVIVMPDYSKAYTHMKKKEDLNYALEHWKAVNEKKGEPQLVGTKCMCCKKADAVTHFESKIAEETENFTKERAVAEGKSASVIYVICKNEADMARVREEVKGIEFSFGLL